MTGPNLRRIKAARVGIVVRSDEFDRDSPVFNWTLFQCTVQEAVELHLPGRTDRHVAGQYRYRIYETIVPLRNPMWNR